MVGCPYILNTPSIPGLSRYTRPLKAPEDRPVECYLHANNDDDNDNDNDTHGFDGDNSDCDDYSFHIE